MNKNMQNQIDKLSKYKINISGKASNKWKISE